jgi:PAS domain S-box-containing protein
MAAWEWDVATGEVRWTGNPGALAGALVATKEAFLATVHEDDRPRVEETLAQALATGDEYEVEFRYSRADGSIGSATTRGRVLGDHDGHPLRMLGITADVTARRHADDALRESEQKLRLAVEQLPAVAWTVDRELRFTSMLGRRHEGVEGLSAESVLGRRLQDLASDERRPSVRAHERALAGEAGEYSTSFGGREYRARVQPLRDAAGEIVGVIGIALDLTDRRRERAELEAVGRLAGGIAHEFNNLLTVLLGHSELLLRSLDPPLREDAQAIRAAGERAAELTRQLLAFARRQILYPQVLDLNALVTEIAQLLAPALGAPVQLVLDLATDLAPVRADRVQLEQAIANLALNARGEGSEPISLTISTTNVELDADTVAARELELVPGPYVILGLRDTGRPLDAATRARIFEPFFMQRGEGAGTGLELASVFGIVRQSGGDIAVATRDERGTSFEIYLPQLERAAAAAAAPARGETILLVEDETTVRALVRGLLEERGYRVLEAESAERALELAASEAIDLLLTDVRMPGLTGTDLAARLTETRPELRVLFTSGFAGTAVDRVNFLPKPFTSAELAAKVREALD